MQGLKSEKREQKFTNYTYTIEKNLCASWASGEIKGSKGEIRI